MKKSYLLKSLFFCCFILLGWWIIDSFLISEAKTQVQLSDDSYNCQGCKCGRPYEADSCVRWDVKFCCNMVQALGNDQLKDNLVVIGNYVIDDDLRDIDLLWDPVSFSFEIQCVDAAGNKIDESNCNPTTKPTSCDVPEVNPTDKYYTVQFDCNGWSNPPENQTFTVGSSQALHANTCTRTNYKFLWWSRTEWWAKDYDDKQSVNPWGTAWSTVVLYAVWEYSPQTYTIEFSKRWDNDVMWTMLDLECKVWESCKLTKNQYSKNNYDFVWWSVMTTPTETPDYLDEASVLDIASGWKTKTLYPIWKSNTPSCTPKRTCNYYNYANNAPSSWCYRRVNPAPKDECWWDLDCFVIWCDKITWKTWWKCYYDINALSPRQQSSMYVVNWWYCADPSLEWWYYWIEEWYSYNGYCGSSYSSVNSCPYSYWWWRCESYQQGNYCKSSTNSCWKCTYLTTEQIFKRGYR